MSLTRGIVTYAAIALLGVEAVAIVGGCAVVAPVLLLGDRDHPSWVPDAGWAVGLGLAYGVLLGAVVVLWSVWASKDLLDRVRTGEPARAGLLGAAGVHVALSAVGLLVPLVLAWTAPVLALLVAAYLLTRPPATPRVGSPEPSAAG